MDENVKTNEFKEKVREALGEMSYEEIEKLKKLLETKSDHSEQYGNGEELSDEQLESVGGGYMSEQEMEEGVDKIIAYFRKYYPTWTDEDIARYRAEGLKTMKDTVERVKRKAAEPQPDPFKELLEYMDKNGRQ